MSSNSVASASASMVNAKFAIALDFLRECLRIINSIPAPDSIKADGLSKEVSDFLGNFRSKAIISKIFCLIRELVSNREDYEKVADRKNIPTIQKQKHFLSVKWNNALNLLLDSLVEDSILNDLLLMNGHHGFYKRVLREPRQRIDVSTREHKKDDGVVLKLSHGRIFADDIDDMEKRLKFYLGECVNPNALRLINPISYMKSKNCITWINGIQYGWEIILTVPITDPVTLQPTGETAEFSTNDPNFLQVFFGGSFPGYRMINNILHSTSIDGVVKYLKFMTLAMLIKSKIIYLINNSRRVPESIGYHYAVITCPRNEPILCGYETVILKPATTDIPHVCGLCRMQLCPFGCGRTHHFGDCDIPPDAATAALIAETTRPCPACLQPVEKNHGCNHMTCHCRVQFCWICMQVYNQDAHGHYMVYEHHRVLNANGRFRCDQGIH